MTLGIFIGVFGVILFAWLAGRITSLRSELDKARQLLAEKSQEILAARIEAQSLRKLFEQPFNIVLSEECIDKIASSTAWHVSQTLNGKPN